MHQLGVCPLQIVQVHESGSPTQLNRTEPVCTAHYQKVTQLLLRLPLGFLSLDNQMKESFVTVNQ